MNFLELAKARYSERDFSAQTIEEDKVMAILEAGRVAPTAANCQPQRIVALREQEGLAKVGKAANIYGAPLALVVCCDKAKTWTRPFDKKTVYDIDASIVTDHMMLRAADLGLASVWICYFRPEVLRQEFSIPENWEIVNILAVGYAKGAPASPTRHDAERLPLTDTVWFEHL